MSALAKKVIWINKQIIGADKFIRDDKTQGSLGQTLLIWWAWRGAHKTSLLWGLWSLNCLQSDTAQVIQSSRNLMKAAEQQIHSVST